jgi:hypothetical protein
MPYFQPPLSGHRCLYRGKRFYVFAVDALHPYLGHEALADVLVYDKRVGAVVAFCDANLNGYVAAAACPNEVPIYGANPKALVREVQTALKILGRTACGVAP